MFFHSSPVLFFSFLLLTISTVSFAALLPNHQFGPARLQHVHTPALANSEHHRILSTRDDPKTKVKVVPVSGPTPYTLMDTLREFLKRLFAHVLAGNGNGEGKLKAAGGTITVMIQPTPIEGSPSMESVVVSTAHVVSSSFASSLSGTSTGANMPESEIGAPTPTSTPTSTLFPQIVTILISPSPIAASTPQAAETPSPTNSESPSTASPSAPIPTAEDGTVHILPFPYPLPSHNTTSEFSKSPNSTTTIRSTRTLYITETVHAVRLHTYNTNTNTPIAPTTSPRYQNATMGTLPTAQATGHAVPFLLPHPLLPPISVSPTPTPSPSPSPELNLSILCPSSSSSSGYIHTLTLPLLSTFWPPSLSVLPGCLPPPLNSSSSLPNCTTLGSQIAHCQSLGTTVLLTITASDPGAVAGNLQYGDPLSNPFPFGPYFTDTNNVDTNANSEGKQPPNLFTPLHTPSTLAYTLFTLFGPVSSSSSTQPSSFGSYPRPLGSNVSLNGFLVRVPREWWGTYQGRAFGVFVERLRELEDSAFLDGDGGVGSVGRRGIVELEWV
ncbi:hypothetical protein BCR34DRAFT_587204 [Clohesyomyces aquaticus]|uniref:Uncharacterized protein n=1 Tax=Clohesyomyces aquaticus TaxID=1231657 RepID=A0A1Y1ZQA1_9PLEO|nr:hypothetical protein BCR34DRAFT_587204 [Clohesyomyces aquaticus]